MPKRKVGPFELEQRLGVGGMGTVYLATYLKTGQQIALKVLSPALSADKQLLARFEREMAILKKLRHPHIVQYYGGGKFGNQHYYAMELMSGGSLDRLLKQKGRVSWEQAIELALQITQALEHAHKHGIVHRDLKPANLFFAKDGRLKLGDFGIARDTQRTALTAAGKTVGTYAYMAPEQISGKSPVSGKTDLYALGCVLFEMLTGQPPFEADNPAEMFYKHLEAEPQRVTAVAIDCPVWLEAVVMKLLEKKPEDRYYDALAVQVALEDVGTKVMEQESLLTQTAADGRSGLTIQDGAPELKRLLGKKKKRKKKRSVPLWERTWFLATCLLLLIGAVTWTMWPLSEDELFARAERLMASDAPMADQEARRKYLEPLLERFPDGRYAEKAREYIEQMEMNMAERRAVSRARRGQEPESEAERLFVAAWQYEQFGDRVTALEKYRSMAELLKGREQDRPFLNLARQRVATIEEAGTATNDRVQIVNDSLRRAEALYQQGEVLKARKIWNSIVTLYGSNLEFEPQVKYARARLANRDVEPFDFDRSASPAAPEDAGEPVEQTGIRDSP